MFGSLAVPVVTVVSHVLLSFLVFNLWPSFFPMFRDVQLAMLGLWVGFGGRRWYARFVLTILAAPLSWTCLAFHSNYGWEKTFALFANLPWVAENVLPAVVLPALFVRFVYPREIKHESDSPSLALRGQFRLGSTFIWTCGVALFFAAMRFLSGSVSLNVGGVVGSNSIQATLMLKCVVIATWSCSIALLAIAVMRKNRLLSYGLPSTLALILVSVIPWLLFAGGGISSRSPDDYLGSVVLGRFTWVLGWVFAYIVAFATLFAIRRFRPCSNTTELGLNVKGEQSATDTTPDDQGLAGYVQDNRLQVVRPALLSG